MLQLLPLPPAAAAMAAAAPATLYLVLLLLPPLPPRRLMLPLPLPHVPPPPRLPPEDVLRQACVMVGAVVAAALHTGDGARGDPLWPHQRGRGGAGSSEGD
jgi:hypothetical protein